MNRQIGRLTVVLFVQLVVVALLWAWPDDGSDESAIFIDVQPGTVDRVQIADGDGEVELIRRDGVWLSNGLPGDTLKIDDLIQKFSALQAPWPVANSTSSAERFEVSQINFQRRVRLHAGDQLLAEFYLGTSPGYRRVHARLSERADIYSVELLNYEVTANVDSWLDRSIFAFDDSPDSIFVTFADDATGKVVLTRSPEGWLYQDMVAEQDSARTYAGRFANLQILGVAEESIQAASVARFEVVAEAVSHDFSIYALESGEDYLIAWSDGAPKYRLATYTAEQLLMIDTDFSVQEQVVKD